MRYKYEQVLSIIHQQLSRETQEDEVCIVMSKLYLFSYLNDVRYTIDNLTAERFIRPLAGEYKNLLFFVGSCMAKYIGSLSYAAINMPNEQVVNSRIPQEIFPRNCQRKKGL